MMLYFISYIARNIYQTLIIIGIVRRHIILSVMSKQQEKKNENNDDDNSNNIIVHFPFHDIIYTHTHTQYFPFNFLLSLFIFKIFMPSPKR